MKYNPEIHNRKSARLKNYNYAKDGTYFITICTKNREPILSKIINVGVDAHIDPKIQFQQNKNDDIKIELKHYGKIVNKYIQNVNNVYSNVNVDISVIMPNHIHMIIYIKPGSMWASTPTKGKITIPKIIRSIKILTTNEIGYSIWQRNYYEHIIRNENEYYKICEYINQNPLRWLQKT